MATQTQTQTTPSQSVSVLNDIEIPRGTVTSSLIFYAPPEDGSAPFSYIEAPPEGSPQRNFGPSPHEITVTDIRGREHEFDMNKHGFCTVSDAHTEEKDFTDDEHVKKVYYPEVEKLLLENIPGAKRVHLFDHRIRGCAPDAKHAPVMSVHVDYTVKSAETVLRTHIKDEATELMKGRYRLINVWRPLNGPVVSKPLAFAASQSVSDDNLVSVELRFPDRVSETAMVTNSDEAKWYYWSGMTNDEMLLLQCFDSQDHARVPHSAFEDPRSKPEWTGRESLEMRAAVFG